MKKILILTFGLLLSTIAIKAADNDSLTVTQVYNDVKSLYKDDLKDVVKYSVNKADTLITKGYRVLSKGAAHTYDILVFQQKVNSLNYLFYFIIGIILTIISIYRVTVYLKNPNENNGLILSITIIVSLFLDVLNAFNFNDMLTGFFNPEYGAIKEIIQNLP